MCSSKLYAQAFVLMLVVAQDEEVVSVPLAVSLSLHAALLDGEIGGEVGALLEGGLLDEFSALAAFILHEAANATSFYRTYLLLVCIVGTCLFVLLSSRWRCCGESAWQLLALLSSLPLLVRCSCMYAAVAVVARSPRAAAAVLPPFLNPPFLNPPFLNPYLYEPLRHTATRA